MVCFRNLYNDMHKIHVYLNLDLCWFVQRMDVLTVFEITRLQVTRRGIRCPWNPTLSDTPEPMDRTTKFHIDDETVGRKVFHLGPRRGDLRPTRRPGRKSLILYHPHYETLRGPLQSFPTEDGPRERTVSETPSSTGQRPGHSSDTPSGTPLDFGGVGTLPRWQLDGELTLECRLGFVRVDSSRFGDSVSGTPISCK